jgi:hypothetical protein
MTSLKRVSEPNHLQNSWIFSDEFWCQSVEYLSTPNQIRGLSHDGVACVENHPMMNHVLRRLRMGLMIGDGDVWFSLMLGCWILCQLIGVVILVLGVEPLMVFLLE